MRCVLALVLSLASGPAFALSCVESSIAMDYQRAAKADETYIVVRGKIRFDEDLLPKTDWQNQQDTPPQTDIPAQLTGNAMTRSGFNHPFNQDITLRVLCFGPWCGGFAQGDMLAFVQRTGEDHIVEVGPCPGMSYLNPTREQAETVLRCARGSCKSRSH